MVIDVATGQITNTIVDSGLDYTDVPAALQISPDGSTLYLLCTGARGGYKGALAVIDIASQTSTNIPAPASFSGTFVLTPDAKRVYVAIDPAAGALAELDLETAHVMAFLPVGAQALALSPDGATLYAAGSSLTILATATNQTIATIPLPSASSLPFPLLALNPSRHAAYYAFQESSEPYQSYVAVIDLFTRTIARTFPLASNPGSIALSSDGASLYVGLASPTLVSALDYTTGRTVGPIELPGPPLIGNTFGVPHPLAVSRDGGRLFAAFDAYLTSSASIAGLAAVDISTLRVVKSVNFNGRRPLSMVAPSPDGAILYVPTFPSSGGGPSDIEAFDSSSLALKKTLPIDGVSNFLISPDGKYLYGDIDTGVIKVDLATGNIVGSFTLTGAYIVSMLALTPAGDTLYVGIVPENPGSSSIQILAAQSFFPTGSLPFCGGYLALSPDGKTLYTDDCVVGSPTILDSVDLATGTLRGSITLPVFDANLAITPDGQQIWTPGQIKDTTAGIIAYHLAGAMGAVLPTLSNQAVAFAPLVPAVPR